MKYFINDDIKSTLYHKIYIYNVYIVYTYICTSSATQEEMDVIFAVVSVFFLCLPNVRLVNDTDMGEKSLYFMTIEYS